MFLLWKINFKIISIALKIWKSIFSALRPFICGTSHFYETTISTYSCSIALFADSDVSHSINLENKVHQGKLVGLTFIALKKVDRTCYWSVLFLFRVPNYYTQFFLSAIIISMRKIFDYLLKFWETMKNFLRKAPWVSFRLINQKIDPL